MKEISSIRIRAAATIIVAMAICLLALPNTAKAIESSAYRADTAQKEELLEFERRVANIWGSSNVWRPAPAVWVRYESDLGERSAVDFQTGEARLQILLKASDDPYREPVLAHLRQGLGNLILGEAKDPVEMIKESGSEIQAVQRNRSEREIRVYIVRRGDSLWEIAPKNNVELGTAYLNILENRYMGGIVNHESRTYCAVAAYNAGAANVGRAFIARKSINEATPKINLLKPRKVYERLVKHLPFRESRIYLRKVLSRSRLYRDWK